VTPWPLRWMNRKEINSTGATERGGTFLGSF
jgi:hypothetical protein